MISLKEVQEATPAESLEEQRVMLSIERTDPTGESSRFFHAATSIPAEMVEGGAHAVVEKQEENDHAQPIRLLENQSGRRTVQEDLFACTNSINELHIDNLTTTPAGDEFDLSSNIAPPLNVYQGGGKVGPSSQADTFAANAGKIFHRFAVANVKKNEKKKKGATSPTSVLTSNADSLEEGHIESDSGKASSLKEKLQQQDALDSMNEFRAIITSHRKHTQSYMGLSMFFVIIPSTILAAM